jgi:ACR3 family arsenite transporter
MEIQSEKMPVQKESQEESNNALQQKRSFSAFASLGLLDRFLAVWIFLAMAIGIILGNFVPSMSPALEKGTFVGVSIPIGKSLQFDLFNDLFDNNI